MNEELKQLNLNESIINIRVELQNSKLKKSGKNSYAGFQYFELADFLPTLNKLMLKYGVNDIFSINETDKGGYTAVLKLVKGSEWNAYTIPFTIYDTPVNTKYGKNGEVRKVKSMQDIQYLGALNTYYKRYLYLNAFGITDGEVIDSMENSEEADETDYKKLVMEEIKKQGLNANEVAKQYSLNSKTTQQKAKAVLEALRGVNNAS